MVRPKYTPEFTQEQMDKFTALKAEGCGSEYAMSMCGIRTTVERKAFRNTPFYKSTVKRKLSRSIQSQYVINITEGKKNENVDIEKHHPNHVPRGKQFYSK